MSALPLAPLWDFMFIHWDNNPQEKRYPVCQEHHHGHLGVTWHPCDYFWQISWEGFSYKSLNSLPRYANLLGLEWMVDSITDLSRMPFIPPTLPFYQLYFHASDYTWTPQMPFIGIYSWLDCFLFKARSHRKAWTPWQCLNRFWRVLHCGLMCFVAKGKAAHNQLYSLCT